ncbi:ataxin-3-like [Octopus vulgaris]|uniref:Ataxin-3 homolog n=1 Tax=Octopus vulgaris TaxID=6645 RepID=A0AA36FA03_OCTVU|nr:ataxin-3-like [Octopus vulgaris]
MEAIVFEKQQGSLCALHCLNSLLQGQYFSPIDLAQIAKKLDDQEREQMAEGGENSQEYMHFLEQPSSNMDERGYFSIQVITNALGVWNLDIIPFSSQHPKAKEAQENPLQQTAYICNMKEHWFTIRKIGFQWFNLNSLLSGPELISDTYLSLFIIQLLQEGYSIFIIIGNLPPSDADQLLKIHPAVQPVKPTLESAAPLTASSSEDQMDPSLQQVIETTREYAEKDDPSLQRALAMSLKDKEEALLQTALELSMQGDKAEDNCLGTEDTTPDLEVHHTWGMPQSLHSQQPQTQKPSKQPISIDELRQKRLNYLSKTNCLQNNAADSSSVTNMENESESVKENGENGENGEELSEEEMLQKAIYMSMKAAEPM